MEIDIVLLGNGLPNRLFPARKLCDSLPTRLYPLDRFRWHYYDEGRADLVQFVTDLKVWLEKYDSKYETNKKVRRRCCTIY
jgi:hypothetical protein